MPAPHDSLIKKMLQDPTFSREFLITFLPKYIGEKLLWDTLRPSEATFIDEDLRSHFADAVFEIDALSKLGKGDLQISILIEHKSNQDRYVVLQLMRYLYNAYNSQVEQSRYRLMPVIPIVIYHGTEQWEAKPLAELFDKVYEEFTHLVPLIPFFFQNISSLSDEQIFSLGYTFLRAIVLTQKNSHNPQRLFEQLNLIFSTLNEGAGRNYFSHLFVHIIEVLITEYAVNEVFNQINPPMSAEIKSLYDKIIFEAQHEGMEKGMERGMEKGVREEKERTVLRMASQDFSIDQIAFSVELPLEEVESIIRTNQSS